MACDTTKMTAKATLDDGMLIIEVVCPTHGAQRFAEIPESEIGDWLAMGSLSVVIGEFPGDVYDRIVAAVVEATGNPQFNQYRLN